MGTIQLHLPDDLDTHETEIKIVLAGELYERGKLTLGQAAEVAGLTKRAFIEIMGKYGFSIFSDNPEDFLSDIANA